jgi:hypothetical protein
VDLLIDIVGPTTPWFPGALLNDLEKALGHKVDVVVARSLNPLLPDSVLQRSYSAVADRSDMLVAFTQTLFKSFARQPESSPTLRTMSSFRPRFFGITTGRCKPGLVMM